MDDTPVTTVNYQELAVLADALLERCDEDILLLAENLDALPDLERSELLASDFLNAFQVFYYYFRTLPEELEIERMMLLPASELQYGMRINEIDLLELLFVVVDKKAFMIVSDGEKALARFTGRGAYRAALEYITSAL